MKLSIFSLLRADNKEFKLTFDNTGQEVIDYLNSEYPDYKKTYSQTIDVGRIIDLNQKEAEKTFYLLGEAAAKTYEENGIEGVVSEYEANELSFGYFCFVEGVTKSHELAEAMDGWNDFTIITEEEFNQINEQDEHRKQ